MRYTAVEAYYLYDTLWGPARGISARLAAIRFRPGCSFSLESADEDTKRAYGAIVRRYECSLVATARIVKRRRIRSPWPGTRNMPGYSVHNMCARWLAAQLGITVKQASEVIYSYA